MFPNENQPPAGERERAQTLAILWQVRHNITHNTRVLTGSDARRLTLMVKSQVVPGGALNPEVSDLRYVKRFLVETANKTNTRVATRVAELLDKRYQDDSTLFDPQQQVDKISKKFQQVLEIGKLQGNL